MPGLHHVRRVLIRPKVVAAQGGGAFAANAVNFDGTNDYFSTQNLTTSNSKTFTCSFWINLAAAGDGVSQYLMGRTGSGGVELNRRDDDALAIFAYNTTGTQILEMYTNAGTTLVSADGWTHVLISVDQASGGAARLYINDTDDVPRVFVRTDDTIDHTDGTPLFNANGSGAAKYNGDVAEFYFNTATAIDITVESNRRKFIDVNGKPVDLGSDGSTPTGSSPAIFLSGATGSWHTNLGGGGGFTLNGTLDTAATSPSD